MEIVYHQMAQVEARRTKLLTHVFLPRVSTIPVIEDVISAVRQQLPTGVSYDALFESLRYLAGQVLTEQEATAAAWRLAGNVELLKAGTAVPPWSIQRADEWVPLQILKIRKGLNAKRQHGNFVTLKVLAGTPAGLLINTFWGIPITRHVARTIGFSQSFGLFPFYAADDLVGLRLYGKVEAERSRSRPEFHEIGCPDSMINWNRDHVLRIRLRVKGVKCPQEYTHPCRQCAIGADQCIAATHPMTYVLGDCPKCGKPDQLFDPADSTTQWCLYCAASTTP